MTTDVNWVLVFQGIIVALIGYGVREAYLIRREFTILNGRLGRMEEWRAGHVKLDDEREDKTENRLTGLEHKKGE